MNCYQKYLNSLFSEYRPLPTYPTYPPYHSGDYLEDYFYNQFLSNNVSVNRYYIPVSWTTVYIQNQTHGLQEKLNSLNPDYQYFTVCQHDDAPKEKLPCSCLVFSAGGNVRNKQTIPIPLVCSAIPDNIKDKNLSKKYMASFIGSITHPIRQSLCKYYQHNKNFYILGKNWSPSVSENNLEDFIRITQQSYFAFCPRGYGLNSFRLYEVLQLGVVPIIISNDFYLPWSDEIDWNSFSVLINENEIYNIENILNKIDNKKYNELVFSGKKLYHKYFTLQSTYDNIIKKI